jgi:hypothetical protein
MASPGSKPAEAYGALRFISPDSGTQYPWCGDSEIVMRNSRGPFFRLKARGGSEWTFATDEQRQSWKRRGDTGMPERSGPDFQKFRRAIFRRDFGIRTQV